MMDVNRILVVDSDPATRTWLRDLFSGHGYDVEASQGGMEGLVKAESGRYDLVILDLELEDIDGEDVIEELQKKSSLARIPIVLFTTRLDLLDISRLFQLGISDYAIKRAGVENELLGKVSSSLFRAKSSGGIKPKGKLISFFSAKGGNGTSTLCLNLAHSLAESLKPKSVLVVDLVLPLGSIAIMTGIEHADSIANLTSEVKPQDTKGLKAFLLPVIDWSVSILPGSESVEDSQKLEPRRIVPILSSLLRAFDYVFVDLGKTLSNISQSVMNYSDVVAVVVGPDLLTAELTQIALKHLEKIGVDEEKTFLILNRAVGLEGMTKVEMERVMGKPIRRTVRYARDNFTIATNQHLPYAVQFQDDALAMELQSLSVMLGKFASAS